MLNLIPFLTENTEGSFLVGTKDGDYTGPVAQIYYDKQWLFVETDPYEGQAMLHIEALPKLIEALQKISEILESHTTA